MIDPNTGEEQVNPLESMMESTILQNESLKEQGSETNSLLEALVLQSQNNYIEPVLEAQIVNDNQNTEKLVGAIKELKPELEKSASSTDRMVNFLEEMKGEKGDSPTDEELIALIEPRIPAPIKGEDGKTPTPEELVDLIEPMVDEKMPTDERLVELITPLIPPPIKPRDGIDGTDADEESIVKKVLKKVPKPKDGKDGSPDTGEEIATKLSKLKGDKRLDKSAIKGLDKMQKEIDHVASGSSGQEYRVGGVKKAGNASVANFIAGSNTTITGTPTSDGVDITITATGGGGGAVDSVNGDTGVVVLNQDDILDGTTYKQYSQTEKTKLAGIETGAEVNTIDTVSDTAEIDLTITARALSASIVAGSIDETKLDTSVNASLDLADSAVQDLSDLGITATASEINVLDGITATTTELNYTDGVTSSIQTQIDSKQASLGFTPENSANKGISGGYASLDGSGKVPASQLPAYVDDIIEVANYAALPGTGTTGVLYVTLDTNLVYRWTGSAYVEISPSSGGAWGTITGTLADQTDLQTALDGKVDENASITGATKTKITYDAKGLVTAGADATTADIADSTNKRYVTDAQQTIIAATTASFTTADETKLDGIEAGADVTDATNVGAAGAFMKSVDDADDITVGATNKFATAAEKTKLGHITVTQAVDLDTIESDTTTNNAKVTNATHTGDVTGATALTIANSAVTLAKMADLAQDQFIGRTTASTGVPQTTTITAAARTVLDDTTVAAMVDTLGGATSTGTGGLVRTGSPALVTPSIAAITVSGGILTLPTGATDTLVSKNSTDTLTNKTLTSPILTTPALGTPTSGVMTNVTGTASGLTAGDSTKIGGITVTGTPAVGYVPTATSTSAATWQTPSSPLTVEYSFSTAFETTTRGVPQTSGSGNTVTATSGGLRCNGGSANGYASSKIPMGQTNGFKVFSGNPKFSAQMYWTYSKSGGNDEVTIAFCGIGNPGTSLTSEAFVTNHIGFMVTSTAGGVLNLYATNANGSTQTKSASLETAVTGTNYEFFISVTSDTNIAYYWRKNGGSWSSVLNHTTNIPSSSTSEQHCTVGLIHTEAITGSDNDAYIGGMTYKR